MDGLWFERAACKGVPRDVFFPAELLPGKSEIGWAIALLEARVYCDRCPVRGECLEEGLRTESHGIWGGEIMPATFFKGVDAGKRIYAIYDWIENRMPELELWMEGRRNNESENVTRHKINLLDPVKREAMRKREARRKSSASRVEYFREYNRRQKEKVANDPELRKARNARALANYHKRMEKLKQGDPELLEAHRRKQRESVRAYRERLAADTEEREAQRKKRRELARERRAELVEHPELLEALRKKEREKRKAYLERLRQDPEKWEAYNKKRRERQDEYMERVRQDPERLEAFKKSERDRHRARMERIAQDPEKREAQRIRQNEYTRRYKARLKESAEKNDTGTE